MGGAAKALSFNGLPVRLLPVNEDERRGPSCQGMEFLPVLSGRSRDPGRKVRMLPGAVSHPPPRTGASGSSLIDGLRRAVPGSAAGLPPCLERCSAWLPAAGVWGSAPAAFSSNPAAPRRSGRASRGDAPTSLLDSPGGSSSPARGLLREVM
jgi:hypothetical protein